MLSPQERKVLERIEERRSELVDLLVRLIRFRTVTPLMGAKAEAADYRDLQTFVSKRLTDLGFRVESFEVDASSLPQFPGSGVVPNRDLSGMPVVVGTRTGHGRSLLLNGHYDVVPAGVVENWTHPPFGGEVADGQGFGRGACDMQGGFAAMLFALE